FRKTEAQRTADKAARARHQDAGQPPCSARRRNKYFKRLVHKCITEAPVPAVITGRSELTLTDNKEPLSSPQQFAVSGPPPKLRYLVTEDWYFCSHRLPAARAARDAGFDVVVATRVRAHSDPIRNEGFSLRPLGWRRRGDGLRGAGRAVAEIARLYRTEQPD